MSKNIEIGRCVKCTFFDGHICPLDDLEPCRFTRTPEAEHERAKSIFLAVCVVIALVSSVLFWYLGR